MIGQLRGQLACDQLDRGQGRAQFVRRGCRNPTDCRQALLACQRNLRGRQGLGHRVTLDRDPTGIKSKKNKTDSQRGPDAIAINCRHFQGVSVGLQQRQMRHFHQGNRGHGGQAQSDSGLQPQGGGGDGHRRENEHGERVVQTARQGQHGNQLRKVEEQRQRGPTLVQPLFGRVHDLGDHVETDRSRDGQRTHGQRQLEAHDLRGQQHRGGLACDGHPAQEHQCPEAHPIAAGAQVEHGWLAGPKHANLSQLAPSKKRQNSA